MARALQRLDNDHAREINPRPPHRGRRRRAGVGYREFTRRAALRLSVSGWVRNRSDGAVEALVRGSPASFDALIAEMRLGPRFAVVKRLSVIGQDEPQGGDSGTFVVLSTA
jgi:acylphosphatase